MLSGTKPDLISNGCNGYKAPSSADVESIEIDSTRPPSADEDSNRRLLVEGRLYKADKPEAPPPTMTTSYISLGITLNRSCN